MAETTISSETRYQGRVLNLRLDTVRLSSGQTMVREVVEHAQAVAIVALNALGEVYLVRQHRAGHGGPLLEIPAGTVEAGEEAEACARREIQEEIGWAAEHWDYLGGFYLAPGYSTEWLHLYLARDLRESRRAGDFDEEIEVETAGLEEALRRLLGGEPSDMKTIAGLFLAREFLAGE
jgi:ADP-ribose pyrophosphatase